VMCVFGSLLFLKMSSVQCFLSYELYGVLMFLNGQLNACIDVDVYFLFNGII